MDTFPSLKGVFKQKYGDNLRGRDWLRRIDPEDRRVFAHAGFVASDYGRRGGLARARTAKRDWRGRFAKG